MNSGYRALDDERRACSRSVAHEVRLNEQGGLTRRGLGNFGDDEAGD
jgi:hypothetical protein